MRFGYALLVLGLIGVILGSIRFKSRQEVFRVGDFRATTTQEKTVPAIRYAGVGLIVAGGAVIGLQFRRRQ